MTDDRGRGRRRQLKSLKTSGLFNAGLTPCSHTTTTKSLVSTHPRESIKTKNLRNNIQTRTTKKTKRIT